MTSCAVRVAESEDSDVTIGTYAYDGLGRRIKRVVTNSGDPDGTELYFGATKGISSIIAAVEAPSNQDDRRWQQ